DGTESIEGVLTDPATSEEIEVFGNIFTRISYTFNDQARTSTVAVFDLEDPNINPNSDGFLVLIQGDPINDLPNGIDLAALIGNSPNGGIEDFPPGFGENDFIAFTDFAGVTLQSGGPAPTGLTFAEVLDVAFFYGAAYDRIPDIEGLNFWIDERDGGVEFNTVANAFLAAEEFQLLYGGPADALTPEAYVELLYINTLNRVADLGGFDFWVNELRTGIVDTATILIAFSASEEFRNLNPEIAAIEEVSPSEWAFV
ncbi:MAG: DUF4214 domain-containing protein, partial [Pseudomonadota bacterium]